MNKQYAVATKMFLAAGALWILEAIGEAFGGFVEDFNNNFDYLSEATFGFSFLALFLGLASLIKGFSVAEGRKIGWGAKIGLGLVTIGGILMPIKSIVTMSAGAIGGYNLVQETSILGPTMAIGGLTFLIGSITLGVTFIKNRTLSRWNAILFLLSLFVVIFVPVVGKYVTAGIFFLIALEVSKRQEKGTFSPNITVTH